MSADSIVLASVSDLFSEKRNASRDECFPPGCACFDGSPLPIILQNLVGTSELER